MHAKTKALDIDLLSVRDLHGKVIDAEYVTSGEQIADYLTKPLSPGQFNELVESSRLKRMSSKGIAKRSKAWSALLAIGLHTVMVLPNEARVYRQPYKVDVKVYHPCELFMVRHGVTTPVTLSRTNPVCTLDWHEFERLTCLQNWHRSLYELTNLPKCMRLMKRSALFETLPEEPKITWAGASKTLNQTYAQHGPPDQQLSEFCLSEFAAIAVGLNVF